MTVRLRRIRSLVRELLEQANVEGLPIPVDKIARAQKLEVRLSQNSDSTISGFLFMGGQTPIVGVNAMHHTNRQRFTIGHELGHFLLHGFASQNLHVDHSFQVLLRDERSSEGVDEKEREANSFAAELLMPVDFLRRDLQDRGPIDIESDDFIRELARRYQVSQQAMVFRLTNLGYLAL